MLALSSRAILDPGVGLFFTPSSLERCGCRGDAVDVHGVQLVDIYLQLCCVSTVRSDSQFGPDPPPSSSLVLVIFFLPTSNFKGTLLSESLL